MSFSSATIVEAMSLVGDWNHARIDELAIRYRLREALSFPADEHISRRKKTNALAEYLIDHPQETGPGGSSLTFEVIEHVVSECWVDEPDDDFLGGSHFEEEQEALEDLRFRLAQDGYAIRDGALAPTLPEEIDLPKKTNELEVLLRKFEFDTARGHFEQALSNHARGDWAGANSQLRTFVESLFDSIAGRIVDTAGTSSSHQRRELLAKTDPPFFRPDLNEWEVGNNGGFVQGFWRRLHPEGSHPGLSGEADSTFRLHLVVLMARHYLARLEKRP